MEKFTLLEVRPYMIDQDDRLYELLKSIPYKDKFNQTNEFFNMTKQEMKNRICENMKKAYSVNLSRNIMPCEYFVLRVDERYVCIGALRLKVNKYWLRHSGHIWYKTSPKERNKGYATKFVELLKQRAKEFGISEIFSQCNKENIYSLKVLKNNDFVEYENNQVDWEDTIFLKCEL